jgi:hypothetical protein
MEGRSGKRCCRGKAISVTSKALVPFYVIFGPAGSTVFLDIISQTARFYGKKLLKIKRVF